MILESIFYQNLQMLIKSTARGFRSPDFQVKSPTLSQLSYDGCVVSHRRREGGTPLGRFSTGGLRRRPRRPAPGDSADVLKLHISRIRLDVNHIPTRRIGRRRTRSIRTGNGRYVGKRWIQESVGIYRDTRGRPAGRGAGAKLRLEQQGLLRRLGLKRLRKSAVLALETNDALRAQGQIVLALGAKA